MEAHQPYQCTRRRDCLTRHLPERLLELAGGQNLELGLANQITQSKFTPFKVLSSENQKARKVIEREVALSHEHQSLTYRLFPRLACSNKDTIAAALARQIREDEFEVGIVLSLISNVTRRASSQELQRFSDKLLPVFINSGFPYYAQYLSGYYSDSALEAALRSTVSMGDHTVADMLLRCGAKPDSIPLDRLLQLVISDVKMIDLLIRSENELQEFKMNMLCEAACEAKDPELLRLLLRAPSRKSCFEITAKKRDDLLLEALRNGEREIFTLLAVMTFCTPIENVGLTAVEAFTITKGNKSLQRRVVEILLCLMQHCCKDEIKLALGLICCECIGRNEQILELLIAYNHSIPASALHRACQQATSETLQLCLRGTVDIREDIWDCIAGRPKDTAVQMQKLVLTYLNDRNIAIPGARLLLLEHTETPSHALVELILQRFSPSNRLELGESEILANAVLSRDVPMLKLILEKTDNDSASIGNALLAASLMGPVVGMDMINELLLWSPPPIYIGYVLIASIFGDTDPCDLHLRRDLIRDMPVCNQNPHIVQRNLVEVCATLSITRSKYAERLQPDTKLFKAHLHCAFRNAMVELYTLAYDVPTCYKHLKCTFHEAIAEFRDLAYDVPMCGDEDCTEFVPKLLRFYSEFTHAFCCLMSGYTPSRFDRAFAFSVLIRLTHTVDHCYEAGDKLSRLIEYSTTNLYDFFLSEHYSELVLWSTKPSRLQLFAILLKKCFRSQSILPHYPSRFTAKLPTKQVVLCVEVLHEYFRCLDLFCIDDTEFTTLVSTLFEPAYEVGRLKILVELCMRSCWKLHVSKVIWTLKKAILNDTDCGYLSQLLQPGSVATDDLETLWTDLWKGLGPNPSPISCYSKIAARVKLLLGAGCDGPMVGERMLEICRKSTLPSMLELFLEDWKSAKDRPKCDHLESIYPHIPELLIRYTGPHCCWIAGLLGYCLCLCLEQNKTNFCVKLLKAGAAAPLDRKWVINSVVSMGSKLTSLVEDEALQTAIVTLGSPDPESFLSWTLVEAVKHRRNRLFHDVIELVTHPSGNTCVDVRSVLLHWKACPTKLDDVLSAILAKVNFSDDPQLQCDVLTSFRNAGLRGGQCFDVSLSKICGTFSVSLDQIELHFSYGASEDSIYLDHLTRILRTKTPLPILDRLLPLCGTQIESHVCSLMIQGSIRIGDSRQDDCEWFVNLVNCLQQFQTPSSTDKSFNLALLTLMTIKSTDATAAAIHLLRRGGRFGDDDGLAFLLCLLRNNPELTKLTLKNHQSSELHRSAIYQVVEQYQHIIDLQSESCGCEHWRTIHDSESKIPQWSCMQTPLRVSVSQLMTIMEDIVCSKRGLELFQFNNYSLTSLLSKASAQSQHVLPILLKRAFLLKLKQGLLADISDYARIWDELVAEMVAIMSESLLETDHIQDLLLVVLDKERCDPHRLLLTSELNELLLVSTKRNFTHVSYSLLSLGANPSCVDINGLSALNHSILCGNVEMVDKLICQNAQVNDGSLHIAACQQNIRVMGILLNVGHSCDHVHENLTPLVAWATHIHSAHDVAHFDQVVRLLLGREFQRSSHANPLSGWILPRSSRSEMINDIVTALQMALERPQAFAKVQALLSDVENIIELAGFGPQYLFSKGHLRFSLLGLTQCWEQSKLSSDERGHIGNRLRKSGFECIYYAAEGDQPPTATGVPLELLRGEEARKRRNAFRNKDCSVATVCDRDYLESEIYAALTAECESTHGWNDNIICKGCLTEHLKIQMFPGDDENSKYKFPSTRVKCWAPQCSVMLPYHVIRELVDAELFATYDDGLFQQHLRGGKTIAKCATNECPGATWFRDNQGQSTRYYCDLCRKSTCLICNDMFEKHNGKPCPAGEQRKKDERLQREEALSEALMKAQKKCPYEDCGIKIEKVETTCDVMVCGKNTHAQGPAKSGCGRPFCYNCLQIGSRVHKPHCKYYHG